MDVDVTRWPPATTFPPTTPAQGVRTDRRGDDGLSYKLWVTDDGAESAVYRPEAQAANVAAFLQVVREVVTGYAATCEDGFLNTGGELVDTAAMFDVNGLAGGSEERGSGFGNMHDGPSLPLSTLFELVLEDVEARLND